MKYSCTVDIDVGIAKVVSLWTDERYFDQWQDGFQAIENLEGEPGAVGTTSRILFQQGKRKLELLETIVVNALPEQKKAFYEHSHMTNFQTSRFESLSENKTRYVSEVEYTEFRALIPKLMAKLFPGMFRKQSQKWMDQFKAFAERMA
ncbi:SRPBCC family protein [Spongiimicrobium salis]|uniref:SRPBCC family protein n=1 Tax=Spongiimicrobium salis TaxID=1667022 RepID=UPI00374CB034